jgi:hypothetical protein
MEDNAKAFGYADDINAITKDNVAAIQEIFSEYEKLTKLCGLELNANKTEVITSKTYNAFNGKNLQQPAMQASLHLAPMGPHSPAPDGGIQPITQNTISNTTKFKYMGKTFNITPKPSIKICGIIIGTDGNKNISDNLIFGK